MPSVIIHAPKIVDMDVKREFIEKLTDLLEKTYKLPRQSYYIYLKEDPPENVGIGGHLISDVGK
jgi:4-oxalocrotonate tautomerase